MMKNCNKIWLRALYGAVACLLLAISSPSAHGILGLEKLVGGDSKEKEAGSADEAQLKSKSLMQTLGSSGGFGKTEIALTILTLLDNIDEVEDEVNSAQTMMSESLGHYNQSMYIQRALISEYNQALRTSGLLKNLTDDLGEQIAFSKWEKIEASDSLGAIVLQARQQSEGIMTAQAQLIETYEELIESLGDSGNRDLYLTQIERSKAAFESHSAIFREQILNALSLFNDSERAYRGSTVKLASEYAKIVGKVVLVERLVDDPTSDPRVFEAIQNANRLFKATSEYKERVPVYRKFKMEANQAAAKVRTSGVSMDRASKSLEATFDAIALKEAEVENEAAMLQKSESVSEATVVDASTDDFMSDFLKEEIEEYQIAKDELDLASKSIARPGIKPGQLDGILLANLTAADYKLVGVYPTKADVVALLNDTAFLLSQSEALLVQARSEIGKLSFEVSDSVGAESDAPTPPALEHFGSESILDAFDRVDTYAKRIAALQTAIKTDSKSIERAVKKDPLSIRFSPTLRSARGWIESEAVLIQADAQRVAESFSALIDGLDGEIKRLKDWRELLEDQEDWMKKLVAVEEPEKFELLTVQIAAFAKDLDREHDLAKKIISRGRALSKHLSLAGMSPRDMSAQLASFEPAVEVVRPRETAHVEPITPLFADALDAWHKSRPENDWIAAVPDLEELRQALTDGRVRRSTFIDDLAAREKALYLAIADSSANLRAVNRGTNALLEIIKNARKKPSDQSTLEADLIAAWSSGTPVKSGRRGPFADWLSVVGSLEKSQTKLFKDIEKLRTKDLGKVKDWNALALGLATTITELERKYTLFVDEEHQRLIDARGPYAELIQYVSDEYWNEEIATESISVYSKLLDETVSGEFASDSSVRIKTLDSFVDRKKWYDAGAAALIQRHKQLPNRINASINLLRQVESIVLEKSQEVALNQ
ncbi:MAG: hypothetical protein MK080_11925 [Opitutales bacterium]|nr:hypothetical protein [Opitutales bacterium]NRA27140.1 hypothetical protein [Opitutales bacterium]